ncbi:MAG TPA: ATP phosphoribosyltransferase [Firmicutes bacterium]|nr:ATP phosphoribosyltransferase [Bacillota bacterium]
MRVAVAKGRLLEPLLELFRKAGLVSPGFDLRDDFRRLMVEDEGSGLSFLLVKPVDVPTYVEYGAADLGVVGKDVLWEAGRQVCELLDLGFGFCRLVVAAPRRAGWQSLRSLPYSPRIATKYPRIAEEYFAQQGIQVEIVKLNGAIELAPGAGLAEAIVDLVATGRTLAENDLVPLGEIGQATARLIANRISYKVEYDRIREMGERLRQALVGRGDERRAREGADRTEGDQA